MTQLTLVGGPGPDPGRVYYMTDGYNIKIGYTAREARRRGGELKTEVIYSTPGTQLDERRHHRMWAKYRIDSTEWFRPSDELLLWLFVQVSGDRPTRALATLRQVSFNHKRTEKAA